jgi:peroxiredoxin Q/BCP
MPEVGDAAPKFSGTTQDGDRVSLSDYRGRKLALYFYPKDDTPGCTKQACNLRDGYRDLLDAGVAVVGVSIDSQASHEKFADKYELPFPLIADVDKKVVSAYGVYGEKNLYGRKFMGTNRTTFLIDEDGKIVHVFKRPKVKEHTVEILARFSAD